MKGSTWNYVCNIFPKIAENTKEFIGYIYKVKKFLIQIKKLINLKRSSKKRCDEVITIPAHQLIYK